MLSLRFAWRPGVTPGMMLAALDPGVRAVYLQSSGVFREVKASADRLIAAYSVQEAVALVSTDPCWLLSLPDALRSSKAVVLAAVSKRGSALELAPDRPVHFRGPRSAPSASRLCHRSPGSATADRGQQTAD